MTHNGSKLKTRSWIGIGSDLTRKVKLKVKTKVKPNLQLPPNVTAYKRTKTRFICRSYIADPTYPTKATPEYQVSMHIRMSFRILAPVTSILNFNDSAAKTGLT